MSSFLVFRKLWGLLSPFHSDFRRYLAKITVYETFQLFESLSLSIVVLMFQGRVDILVWALVFFGFLVYDELFVRLDNAVDWHIVSGHSYPTYRHLKNQALKKFMSLEIPWHHEHNSGALVGKVNHGIDKTEDILDAISWEFVPTLIQVVLSLIPLLFISWPTALIALVVAVLFFRLTVKSNRARKPYKEARHDLYDEDWNLMIQYVQAVETVAIFNQADRLQTEYKAILDGVVDSGLKEARIGIFTYNRIRIRILTWSKRLILLLWVAQLSTGSIGIPALIYAYSLTERLFHSYWRFARLFDRATEALEGIERLVKLMDEEPKMADSRKWHSIRTPPEIAFCDVCFSYEEGYDQNGGAIHNMNLTINPGEIIAIVGPSGSGKTTTRRLIARLVEVDEGVITIDGIDVSTIAIEQLRSLITTVPQGDDVAIFDNTIRANIAFANPCARDEEIVNAAKLAGIHTFIQSLPEGYMALVGEHGHKLSGGQKQRIGLARAVLMNKCPIIFFDEATSAVDAITEDEIQKNLKAILAGKTAIIIAHRLSTIWDIADRIVVMDDGRIVEVGTHSALMSQGGLYEQMVRLQLTK